MTQLTFKKQRSLSSMHKINTDYNTIHKFNPHPYLFNCKNMATKFDLSLRSHETSNRFKPDLAQIDLECSQETTHINILINILYIMVLKIKYLGETIEPILIL